MHDALAEGAAPIALGFMTPYPDVEGTRNSREQWLQSEGSPPPAAWIAAMAAEYQVVFLLAACVDAAGFAVYLWLGRGTRQWWDIAGRM